MYYEYTTESCCKHMEVGVNICLYVDVYRSICLCVWCVFVWLCVRVCVRVRMCDGKPSINSAPCCIDHTVRYFWYKVTEAGQGYVHNYQGNILLSKLTGQPKSQGKQEGNQWNGDLYKKVGVRNPLPSMTVISFYFQVSSMLMLACQQLQIKVKVMM